MTRTLLAIAAALFAATTYLAPAAKACVSCEYTPPVVNTPVYSHGAYHHRRRRARAAVKVRRARRARKHIVKTKHAPKTVEAAKAAPAERDVKSENSSIATASFDKSEAVDAKAAPADEPKVSKNETCKKFFATVGMTLTVPCE